MKCSNTAVIGLGFGDEGKGLTVNSLTHNSDFDYVVRYSGGQQAGHTVINNGRRHVFSNFGSGTFNNIPTYWSEYCTFEPVGMMKEYQILKEKGVNPLLIINPKCSITTPYDIVANQTCSTTKYHGTCGVGVGKTKKREENFYSLLVEDLLYPSVLKIKMEMISDYYKVANNKSLVFYDYIDELLNNKNIKILNLNLKNTNNIFEGSQGLLLDQHNGFFPHVTPSNIGSKNILEIGIEPHIVLVTRAFQTRHGNGPMTNKNLIENKYIINNPQETNVFNDRQGNFNKSILDLDLLEYVINKDSYIKDYRNKELYITCLDLMEKYYFTYKNVLHYCDDRNMFINDIKEILKIETITPVDRPDYIK